MLMDAAALGHAKLEVFMEQMAALRECAVPHIDALLAGMIEGKVVHSPPDVGTVDPSLLTMVDAKGISVGFGKVLFRSGDPIKAAESYVSAYPVLGAIEQEHPWFRPMLQTIGARLLHKSPYGMWLRVCVGAGLSMADLFSDAAMIATIFIAGNYGSAAGLLATILLSLVIQSLIVTMNYKHRGWRKLSVELLVVWSGMKPAVDAYRAAVASASEKVPGVMLPPEIEMIAAKMAEVVCESIPGAWIQGRRLLESTSNWTPASLISFGFSILATAFTAALIAYELDTSMQKRREDPDFFGYFPDAPRRRAVAFVCLATCSFILVLAKVSAMALLTLAYWQCVLGYLLADLGVFLVCKGLRGDFYFWIPGYGPLLSVLARIVVKLLVDYTGCIHFRHPLDFGGAHFIGNTILNFGSCYMAIGVYAEYYTGEDKLDSNIMFLALGAMSTAWVLAAAAFVLIIDHKYLVTFVSMQSGRQYVIHNFQTGVDDEARCRILLFNEGLWAPIRGDVKQFIKGKYNTWKAAGPCWFTDDLIALIPDDFLPIAEFGLLNAQGPGGKRQSLRNLSVWDRTRGVSSISVPAPPRPIAFLPAPIASGPPSIASPHPPTASMASGSVSVAVSADEAVLAIAPSPVQHDEATS